MPDPRQLRLMVIEHTCANKCMGRSGHRGGCCTLGDRDYILGPVRDIDEFLERLERVLGRALDRSEVVIEFDEGKALFPERPTWQDPKNFPALRVRTADPRAPCRFYELETGRCSIHEHRPQGCRSFECEWLKNALGMIFHLPEPSDPEGRAVK